MSTAPANSSAQPRSVSSATHSLTLDRGLRALWALRDHPDGLSVSALAELLDTHRAAVYRLLTPLGEHHLVRRLPNGHFALGTGLLELASGVQPRLLELTEAALQTLSDELGVTTALTIRDGEEAVVAAVVVPRDQVIHLTYQTGLRHPIGRGAPGLAILAALAPRDGEPEAVRLARHRGWAESTGQLLPGATGVAAPILSATGDPLASISAVWISGIDHASAGAAVAQAAGSVTSSLAS